MKDGTNGGTSAVRRALLFGSGIVCAIPFLSEKAALLTFVGLYGLFWFIAEEKRARDMFAGVFCFAFGWHLLGFAWFRDMYPDILSSQGFEGAAAVGVLLLTMLAIPAVESLLYAAVSLFVFFAVRRCSDGLRAFLLPSLFVFAEWLETIGTFAFPWCRLPITLRAFPVLWQTASLFGSFFVTYLIALLPCLAAAAVKQKKITRGIVSVFIALAAVVFGFCRMALVEHGYSDDTAFNAAALQGNISEKKKDAPDLQAVHEIYKALITQAADSFDSRYPSLIVTPETVIQTYFDNPRGQTDRYSSLAVSRDCTVALGGFSYEDMIDANAVVFLTPDGEKSAPYRKRHLVPFGEYLPYRVFLTAILPFLDDIDMLSYDLGAGTDSRVASTPCGNVGTLVCFESVFPSLARRSVSEGAEILIVPTNDVWFGTSEGLSHHVAQGALRAVELGVPVIHAANTGVSALIEPTGKCVNTLTAEKRGCITEVLHKMKGKTLYAATGEWFVPLLLLVCLFCMFVPGKECCHES